MKKVIPFKSYKRLSKQEQISACMDNALYPALDQLLQSLNESDKQQWDTYHLIGDLLRSEEVILSPADSRSFLEKVNHQLDRQDAFVKPKSNLFQSSLKSILRWKMKPALVAAMFILTFGMFPATQQWLSAIGSSTISEQSSGLADYLLAHQQFAQQSLAWSADTATQIALTK